MNFLIRNKSFQNLVLQQSHRHSNQLHSHFATNVIPPEYANDKFMGVTGNVFIKFAEDLSPFVRDTLSCKVTHLEPGKMTMTMPYKPEFIGNPLTRVLHGGVTASLIDHCGGFACMSALTDSRYLLSTADLRVDYINPAPADTIHCEATVIAHGKSLMRSDIVAWNKDRTVKIAFGRAAYMLYPNKLIKSSEDAFNSKE